MSGLRSVRVGVKPLIEKLKTNRKRHVEAHNKACDAFRTIAYDKLTKRAAEVKDGQTVSLHFNYNAPESHEEEYNEVISMLEFELNTAGNAAFYDTDNHVSGAPATIELSRDEFRNYVQDNWNWTHQWGTAVSGYCNSAGIVL